MLYSTCPTCYAFFRRYSHLAVGNFTLPVVRVFVGIGIFRRYVFASEKAVFGSVPGGGVYLP